MDTLNELETAVAGQLLLSTAIEQSSEAIVITDAEAVIQYVNPAFEAITRYTSAEVLGRNPRILQSGGQDEAFYRAMWSTLVAGKTWRGRFVNKRKDGGLYTEDAVISPIKDASGGIINYVAVKRDITKELLLEAQYLQAQKMEAVGRLAGGVAHDLNNLLSPIMGYCEIFLQQCRPDDPNRPMLETVRDAGFKASDIVRQLLAFSRKQTLEVLPVDLNKIIEGFGKLLKRTLREDVIIEKKLSPRLPAVLADVGQMEQVIMNLAINSQDAMPSGGRIFIETAVTDLDEAYAAGHQGVRPGRYVMMAISDDGSGMDESVRSRVFEPFFTTKEQGKGTGLGLATVYGIVKQHNGSIWLYSEPGRGTTFKIYLPLAGTKASPLSAAPRPSLKSLRGSETVLLAEDNDGVRNLAEIMLKAQGYAVIPASCGKAALSTLAELKGPLHLLLTDVIMPDMNGRELYQAVALKHPEVKVIYMSGYTDDVIAHHGVLDKGVTLLQKPFSAAALSAKVREVLEKKAVYG